MISPKSWPGAAPRRVRLKRLVNREISLASRVRLADHVLCRDLGDEVVLLDLRSGIYFSLDAVGSRIWRLLRRPQPLAAVVGTLLEEYDVTEARCAADVVRLVTQLRDRGLVALDGRAD